MRGDVKSSAVPRHETAVGEPARPEEAEAHDARAGGASFALDVTGNDAACPLGDGGEGRRNFSGTGRRHAN